MADALGAALRDEMQKSGIQVINRIKTGSHIPVWGGQFSSVPSLLKTYKPDLVIISLGGNDVMLEDPSSRVDHVRRLVGYVGDRPCVWVAPSLWKGETGVLSVIREHSKPCRYFDTNTIAPNLARTKGDPIHPSHPARRKWARILVGWLAHERDPSGTRPWDLRAPVRAERPEDIYDAFSAE
jgi:lysophospholipase L1-like esterase